MPLYDSWLQIAGYFDGDGTIYFSDTTNQPYKLSISLVFVDQSIDQIRNIQEFLRQNGIRTSNILKTSAGTANQVAISEFASVSAALAQLLPYLCKKENEARGALNYYEGTITGNDLNVIFQTEVEAGRRERRERVIAINTPYTRQEGDRVMKELRNDRLRDSFGKFRAKVTPEDYAEIRCKHFEGGRRLCELAKEYPQYARETIRRALGGGRGYVGVKGVGRVDSTDSR